jgi:ribosomal protein S21
MFESEVIMMAKILNKDKYGNTLTADQMIKRFKKQVEKDGILQDVRKHEYFVPKSIKRAEKRARHQRMLRKLGK